MNSQFWADAQALWGMSACGCLQTCVSSTAMVMPQPVVPAVDPDQLAAQQQVFINQQAMLMVSGRDWLGGPQELGKNNALVYVS